MSYEIIKSIKVVKDEYGMYYAKVVSACNNVYPRHYSEWEYKQIKHEGNERITSGYLTKEELEKDILLDYFLGNIQKGSNKYKNTVSAVCLNQDLFKKYYKLDMLYSKVTHHYFSLKHKNKDSIRVQQLSNLMDKLRKMSRDSAKETLYSMMLSRANKKVQFTIKIKGDTFYVNKVNTRTYRTSSVPHVFTSLKLYERVTSSKWWEDNFEVTRIA